MKPVDRVTHQTERPPRLLPILHTLKGARAERGTMNEIEKNYETNNENAIEWLTNQSEISITATQPSLKSKLEKLRAAHPESFTHYTKNMDGSLWVTIPRAWLKINPPRSITWTDEQRKENAARLLQKART